jgi:hypothetical protein
MTQTRYGPVHLALARRKAGKDAWLVISDEPTDVQTLADDGVRFDIAANCLEDQSHGFPLESSLLRSAKALARRWLVLAITTLYLVSQGTEVMTQGTRRWVDPHGFRGSSSLKIGGNWVQLALSRGYALVPRWHLAAEADPEPARASKHQPQNPLRLSIAF